MGCLWRASFVSSKRTGTGRRKEENTKLILALKEEGNKDILHYHAASERTINLAMLCPLGRTAIFRSLNKTYWEENKSNCWQSQPMDRKRPLHLFFNATHRCLTLVGISSESEITMPTLCDVLKKHITKINHNSKSIWVTPVKEMVLKERKLHLRFPQE